jgi:hypothetical protein
MGSASSPHFSTWSYRRTSLSPPALPRDLVVRPAGSGDVAPIVQRDAPSAHSGLSIDLSAERSRADRGRADALVGYALGIGFGMAHLGSASAEDADVLLGLLATLAGGLGVEGRVVRILIPAGDRRLVDGLLSFGFRVFRACQYMVRGGADATAQLRAERRHDVGGG